MQTYQHTQIGYFIIITLAVALVAFFVLAAIPGSNRVAATVSVVLGICLLLFSSLTVVVQNDFVEIKFGPAGIIKKKFDLKEIVSARAVKNSWYYGWGIHYTPSGWLYNVSGLDAVELEMKSGKKYRIGTDDAQNLEQVIQNKIRIGAVFLSPE